MASDSQVRSAFLEQLGRYVDKRMETVSNKVTQAEVMRELELNGVDMSLVGRPLRRAQLQQSIMSRAA